MFDRDLTKLFEAQAKAMNQAVKRHAKRFPKEFMFQLDAKEFTEWRSQIVTSKDDIKGLRKRPLAFTEQGIAMLSTVLRSPIAVEVSIWIMSVSVALRKQDVEPKKANYYLKELLQLIPDFEVESSQYFHDNNEPYRVFELVTFHTARRSFITNLLDAGFSIVQVMKMTDHTKAKTSENT